MLREEFANLKRSWVYHTGMQITTLLVLTASFAIVSFVFIFMVNIETLISNWGNSIRMTVYLKDNLSVEKIETLKNTISKVSGVANIAYVDKSAAKTAFSQQMATYAPSLVSESEFSNPFPASFVVTMQEGLREKQGLKSLEWLAKEINAMDGVEEVSYGQNWVKNFAQFAEAISRSGWLLISVLLAAGLLIISNSIRASISNRKDEIEILELVGATANMIRRPFIFEAATMGLFAICLALAGNYFLFRFGTRFLSENLSFARLSEQLAFLSPLTVTLLVISGPLWGAMSAYLTVRKFNSGWSAAEGQIS